MDWINVSSIDCEALRSTLDAEYSSNNNIREKAIIAVISDFVFNGVNSILLGEKHSKKEHDFSELKFALFFVVNCISWWAIKYLIDLINKELAEKSHSEIGKMGTMEIRELVIGIIW